MNSPVLKVLESFNGISGEICRGHQGRLTHFIRFVGCNLKCSWCDTKHSQDVDGEGFLLTPQQIVQQVIGSGAKHVILTGGEPLLQIHLPELVHLLGLQNIEVSIETNGSMPFEGVISRHSMCSFVADYKLPSSGMMNRMLPTRTFCMDLRQGDFVKMVVRDPVDMFLAIKLLKNEWVNRLFTPVISPMIGTGMDSDLYRCIVDTLWINKLHDVVISVQIHKFLGVR